MEVDVKPAKEPDLAPIMEALGRREEMGLFGCDWDRDPQEVAERPNPCYLGENPGVG